MIALLLITSKGLQTEGQEWANLDAKILECALRTLCITDIFKYMFVLCWCLSMYFQSKCESFTTIIRIKKKKKKTNLWACILPDMNSIL